MEAQGEYDAVLEGNAVHTEGIKIQNQSACHQRT